MPQEQSRPEADITLKSLYQAVDELNQHLAAATTQNAMLLCNGWERLEKQLLRMQLTLEGLQETRNSLSPQVQEPWTREQYLTTPAHVRPPPIQLSTQEDSYGQQPPALQNWEMLSSRLPTGGGSWAA